VVLLGAVYRFKNLYQIRAQSINHPLSLLKKEGKYLLPVIYFPKMKYLTPHTNSNLLDRRSPRTNFG